MAYQSQFNGYVAFKLQSGLGSGASGSGATVMPVTGGQGSRLQKQVQQSGIIRRDGQPLRGRHGTQAVTGSYDSELIVASQEDLMEAVLRGTWDASDLSITEATAGLTSITTGANTIVASAGSWITAGLRVGDVIIMTGHATAANNSRNLRIKSLTASTITVYEDLTVNAVADTAFTITRPKKLICPAAGALVERYFTVEEMFVDIGGSEIFTDCKWGSMRYAMAANGLVTATYALTGTGQYSTLTGGSPPLFSSPTEPSGEALAVADASIAVHGEQMVDLTAFDITIDNGATTLATFGSGAERYSPDVFTGVLSVNLNFTALRKDLQRLIDFSAETVYSLQVLAVENESEPKSFVSIFVPNFTLGDVQRSALSRAAGAMTETITVPAALVGKDLTGGAYEATTVSIQSTGA